MIITMKNENESKPSLSSALSIGTAEILARSPRIGELLPRLHLEAREEVSLEVVDDLIAEHFAGGSDPLGACLRNMRCRSLGLEPASHPLLGEAVALVRQRLRLSRDVRVRVSRDVRFRFRARFGWEGEDGQLVIFLDRYLLDSNLTARALAFHIGCGLYQAMDGAWMVAHQRLLADLDFPQRLCSVFAEHERRYAAAFYGLLACGDLETAIAEAYRRDGTSLADQPPLSLLRALSDHALENGAPYWIARSEDNYEPTYLVHLPAVLQLFTETALCQSLQGGTDGLSWEAFCAQLTEWEERVHSPQEELAEAACLMHPMRVANALYLLGERMDFSDAENLRWVYESVNVNEGVLPWLDDHGWRSEQAFDYGEWLDALIGHYAQHLAEIRQCAAGELFHGPLVMLFSRLCLEGAWNEESARQSLARFLSLAARYGVDETQAHRYFHFVHSQCARAWAKGSQAEEEEEQKAP